MDPLIKKIIANRIEEALQRHGAVNPGPILAELLARARSGGGHSGDVRITLDSGQLATIDGAIETFKPDFQSCFPPEPPKVSMKDEKAIYDNFDKIRRGEVVVVR